MRTPVTRPLESVVRVSIANILPSQSRSVDSVVLFRVTESGNTGTSVLLTTNGRLAIASQSGTINHSSASPTLLATEQQVLETLKPIVHTDWNNISNADPTFPSNFKMAWLDLVISPKGHFNYPVWRYTQPVFYDDVATRTGLPVGWAWPTFYDRNGLIGSSYKRYIFDGSELYWGNQSIDTFYSMMWYDENNNYITGKQLASYMLYRVLYV